MIDFAKITVIAGKGGNGAGSFFHTKGKRRGKADGGDGARGGNVYLVVSRNLSTLEAFRFAKQYKAADGGNGLSGNSRGAEGTDLEVRVPEGTQVKVLGTDVVYDLVEEGEKVLVARAGVGGRGNAHLRDEFGRRPFKGENGQQGETIALELELKLIADVGLVGFPNAGKSTLISALTSARPKIADYPFTTLEPNLGVMEISGPVSSFLPVSARSDNSSMRDGVSKVDLRAVGSPSTAATRKNIVLADIPGLIEGASEGRGLGDLFLRHIERTKILVHLIDATAASHLESYEAIRNELKAYSRELAKKKEIIVINKIDLIDEAQLATIISTFKSKGKRVIAISAKEKLGLDKLIAEIVKRVV
ncbi:MAG: GTPase Obg [Patescibacteria group bacterium]